MALARFIKVTKANAAKDRGFIAVDAICSIFEDRAAHNVSIMTMDGFWYDVLETYDQILAMIDCQDGPAEASKSRYCHRKRFMPPPAEENHHFLNQQDFKEKQGPRVGDIDVFANSRMAGRPKQQRMSKDLPSGEGEGHYVNRSAPKNGIV